MTVKKPFPPAATGGGGGGGVVGADVRVLRGAVVW
jgi:hypothetical protein